LTHYLSPPPPGDRGRNLTPCRCHPSFPYPSPRRPWAKSCDFDEGVGGGLVPLNSQLGGLEVGLPAWVQRLCAGEVGVADDVGWTRSGIGGARRHGDPTVRALLGGRIGLPLYLRRAGHKVVLLRRRWWLELLWWRQRPSYLDRTISVLFLVSFQWLLRWFWLVSLPSVGDKGLTC
jgi:hypothetical protein